MKQLITVFLLFSPLFLFSQNWLLYPFGQQNYYEFEENGEVFIDFEYSDSMYQVGDTIFNVVGYHYLNRQIEPFCEGGLEALDTNSPVRPMSPFVLGHYDGSEVMMMDCAKFEFRNNAQLNEIWMNDFTCLDTDMDSIIFTCTDVGYDEIEDFGVMDSFKRVELHIYHDGIEIASLDWVLTKHHGLMEMIPMKRLFRSKFEPYGIIGYKNDTEEVGEQWLTFDDFYWDYSVGDVLKWEYNSGPNGLPNQATFTHKEYEYWTITNIESTADYFEVDYTKEHYHYEHRPLAGILIETLDTLLDTLVIDKNDFESMIHTPMYGLVQHTNGHLTSVSAVKRDADGIRLTLSGWIYHSQIDSCLLTIFPGSQINEYVTNLGFVNNETFVDGGTYSTRELIGYDLGGGNVWGDLGPLPVPTVEDPEDPENPEDPEEPVDPCDTIVDCRIMDIYPNPVRDFITIGLSDELEDESKHILIYGISGLKEMEYNTVEQTIDISELSEGLYWLRIVIGEDSEEFRFLKY